MRSDMGTWGVGVCGKSLVERGGEWGDTLPVEGSLVAGSGTDTFLYTCNHLCELQGHQKGKVMENISRLIEGKTGKLCKL